MEKVKTSTREIMGPSLPSLSNNLLIKKVLDNFWTGTLHVMLKTLICSWILYFDNVIVKISLLPNWKTLYWSENISTAFNDGHLCYLAVKTRPWNWVFGETYHKKTWVEFSFSKGKLNTIDTLAPVVKLFMLIS